MCFCWHAKKPNKRRKWVRGMMLWMWEGCEEAQKKEQCMWEDHALIPGLVSLWNSFASALTCPPFCEKWPGTHLFNSPSLTPSYSLSAPPFPCWRWLINIQTLISVRCPLLFPRSSATVYLSSPGGHVDQEPTGVMAKQQEGETSNEK